MRIREFSGDATQAPRLMALANFISRRLKDEAVEPRFSRSAFLKLANSMGIPVTSSQLKDLIQKPPLNGIIVDVTGGDSDDDGPGEVVFRGADPELGSDGEPKMTPDMARQTVDTMAKRVAKKNI